MVDSPREMAVQFRVTAKQLPQMKEWKVGKVYPMTLKVKMISEEKHDGSDWEPAGHSARFQIEKVSSTDASSKKSSKRYNRVDHKPM